MIFSVIFLPFSLLSQPLFYCAPLHALFMVLYLITIQLFCYNLTFGEAYLLVLEGTFRAVYSLNPTAITTFSFVPFSTNPSTFRQNFSVSTHKHSLDTWLLFITLVLWIQKWIKYRAFSHEATAECTFFFSFPFIFASSLSFTMAFHILSTSP